MHSNDHTTNMFIICHWKYHIKIYLFIIYKICMYIWIKSCIDNVKYQIKHMFQYIYSNIKAIFVQIQSQGILKLGQFYIMETMLQIYTCRTLKPLSFRIKEKLCGSRNSIGLVWPNAFNLKTWNCFKWFCLLWQSSSSATVTKQIGILCMTCELECPQNCPS